MRLSRLPEDAQLPKEPGIAIGVLMILTLLGLLGGIFYSGFKPGPIEKGTTSILGGVYLFTWGCLFGVSYFFDHKTFFLRGLIWVCERMSFPSGRWMALIYSVWLVSFGGYIFLIGAGWIAS